MYQFVLHIFFLYSYVSMIFHIYIYFSAPLYVTKQLNQYDFLLVSGELTNFLKPLYQVYKRIKLATNRMPHEKLPEEIKN